MPEPARLAAQPAQAKPAEDARDLVKSAAAQELIFGVVGHVGSGTSEVARMLEDVLKDNVLPGGPYETTIIKAREEILDWANSIGEESPKSEPSDLNYVTELQRLGDAMRKSDHAAIARAFVQRIRSTRASALGRDPNSPEPIIPDGKRRAYVLDSIRHPAEVDLLRQVYTGAFTLIGVVCDEERRLTRLVDKYTNAGRKDASTFMERDAKEGIDHGQRVSDAFHLADAFLDNSEDRYLPDGTANPEWDIGDQLSRIVNIISHKRITRPTSSETAMYAAYGAQMRSACLSRQVGAALVDRKGSVVSLGTNEVPKAGGGVYGQGFSEHSQEDSRCAYRTMPAGKARACSNTLEQIAIAVELQELVREVCTIDAQTAEQLLDKLRSSRIGSLLEFSRAVHAEMDALLSAARRGVSPAGCRLFVTTFPCHYCARHLVSAGVDEVQYIEPYPKSRALKLHSDSITHERAHWTAVSDGGEKVLFRPFTGIAPRMYARAFLKKRDLKNEKTGELAIGDERSTGAWGVSRISYPQLEVELGKEKSS